jgi:hypothetical protein
MTREEAWPLIEELAEHATQDRFVYYHHRRVGDLLMWDELATMHRGAGDYRPDERRVMLRTIVCTHIEIIATIGEVSQNGGRRPSAARDVRCTSDSSRNAEPKRPPVSADFVAKVLLAWSSKFILAVHAIFV